MNKHFKLLVLCLSSIIVGFVIGNTASNHSGISDQGENKKSNEPLYWVAPMDSNYKRDKPGKSPMGMDLVPVYKKENTSLGNGAGVVEIEPHVINNLGVKTAYVKRINFSQSIDAVGIVKYDEEKLVHIHPRVEGWVEELYVKTEGGIVEKGQPLYSLYSPELVSAQEEYLIALNRRNSTLIDAAKARLKALQLSDEHINQLQQDREVAQTIVFFSPQSGVVDSLKIREGFYVKPGTTMMSIGQLDQVWVEAEVFERDTPFIAINANVEMTLDYFPGQKWRGTIDYIYPRLNEKNRTLRIRIKLNNQNHRLKPNMYAQLFIENKAVATSLVVPKSAVIRTGKQNRIVLSLGDGHFKSVGVVLGKVNSEYVEIVNGLEAGDKVVSSAHFLIDSESNVSSDLARMTPVDVQGDELMRANVDGVINYIDIENRTLNISREAIEKWGRAPDTIDFAVSDKLKLNDLVLGEAINFTFEVHDDFVVVDITSLMKNDSYSAGVK